VTVLREGGSFDTFRSVIFPMKQQRQLSRAGLVMLVSCWIIVVSLFSAKVVMTPKRHVVADAQNIEQFLRQRQPATQFQPTRQVPDDLLRLHIEIQEKDLAKLRPYRWHPGAQRSRPEVIATVREGGRIYTNVAIHLKGAAGSFRPIDDRPALTLNFAKHEREQNFHGYSKISLNNSVQDRTYISEMLMREVFEAAGVPAPRADHATVLINGRDLGLYVLTEGYNKDFLRRYFKNVKGNLYDGGFCQDVHQKLDLNSGDFPNDTSDLRQLVEAAAEQDADLRWKRLNQVLDMDRFVTSMALEVATLHWDGYSMNRNNYRLFHDLTANKMVFMPHGMDQTFGMFSGGRRTRMDDSILPKMNGLVSRAVLSTRPGIEQYLERIAALQTNILDVSTLTNRVRAIASHIRPTLEAYGPGFAVSHDAAVARLCENIKQRLSFVGQKLTSCREPAVFNAQGERPLTMWVQEVAEISDGANGADGRGAKRESTSALHLRASRVVNPPPSWRTSALLEQGSYRLEGKVKTSGARGDTGACLRISGTQKGVQLVQAADWTPVTFRFAVREPLSEIVFVCELRGDQAEAWFDTNSLKLFRE
jgi:spore coat protein H